MSAENFDESFGLICGVVNLKAELEGDNFVVFTVNDKNGAGNFADVIDSGVIEPGEQFYGHIGVKFLADGWIRCECIFDYEGCGFDFGCEIGGDASAEGPAEEDDLLRHDTFFLFEPSVGSPGIEVCSFFGGGSLAFTVAAVIEDEAIESELVEEVNGVEEIHHIAAIAVAVEDGEFGVWRRDEPAVEQEAVGGFEIDLFEVEAEFNGGAGDLADGLIEEARLHTIHKQPHAEVGRAYQRNDSSDVEKYRIHSGILI